MIYTQTSDKNITTIQTELEEKAKAEGFGILHQYNFKEILQKKGYPITGDITVFELCNPTAAQEALQTYPEISVYLPCRISLYTQEGRTVISTIGIEDIINSFHVNDTFRNYMKDTFTRLKKVIERLK